MTTTTHSSSRTEYLLELMAKGDDAFNSRDWAAVDAVHHLDMVAYITGLAEPVYGRKGHSAAMEQMLGIFPDMHVYSDPSPHPVRERRLDHRCHPRDRDLHRADDPPRRQRDRADRKSVRHRARPDEQVGRRPARRYLRFLGLSSAGATDRSRLVRDRPDSGDRIS
jgi:SnoaL-like polyketide cyclase